MITSEEVKKLASLARLELKSEETEKLRGDLNRILDYVGQVKELDIASAETDISGPINNLREDVDPHESGEFSEKLLKAAPTLADGGQGRSGDYFKVKKILTRE